MYLAPQKIPRAISVLTLGNEDKDKVKGGRDFINNDVMGEHDFLIRLQSNKTTYLHSRIRLSNEPWSHISRT